VNVALASVAASTIAASNGQVGENGSSKTMPIAATVVTTNGAVTTSSIAPLTTVINQNGPNYNNVINVGSGNTQKGGAIKAEISTL
jgi:hypothetical protein